MSDFKEFIQKIGLVGILNVFLFITSILLLPILTKNIPLEDYGVWVQVNITVGLVPSVIMFGLPYAMVRFLPGLKSIEKVKETFYSIFFILASVAIVVTALLMILSGPLSALLFDNNAVIVSLLSVIIFFECMNGLFLNYFRALQQIKKYTLFTILKTLSYFIFITLMIFWGQGILGATIGYLCSSAFLSIVMYAVIFMELGFKLPGFKGVKEYFVFGVPTIPGNLSSWIVESSDRYVIGIFLGAEYVGYYSPGYSLGSMVNMIITPFSIILPAALSRYYDDNNMENVKSTLMSSFKYFLILAIPAAFGVSILSRPMLTELTTSAVATEGYLITPIVAFTALIFGATIIYSQIIVLEKKTKVTGSLWVIAAVVNLGLNFILVPYIGIIGAAVTTLIAYSLVMIFTLIYSYKYIKLDFDIVLLIKIIIASIIMSGAISLLSPVNTIEVIVAIICGMVVYTLAILAIGGIKMKDVTSFIGLMKN